MMSPIAAGSIVFGCAFGGSLLGLFIRSRLPEHHRGAESKDIVRLGMGLIGTMTALVLGLLIASAKGSYDAEKSELTQMSAKIVFLDVVLANYGPEGQQARDLLRSSAKRLVERIWPEDSSQPGQLDPTAASAEPVYQALLRLAPQDEIQRSLKPQALALANDIGQTRWLLFEQAGSSISVPFLVVVVFWLLILFVSFGLFAPPNGTVIATLCVCALSVAFAIFLILELDRPFDGVMQISSAPLVRAVEHLGH
jgi:Protein of unknown function (DUF4239)